MSSFLCRPQTIYNAASAIYLKEPFDDYVIDTSDAEWELALLNINGYRARYSRIPETKSDVLEFRANMHEWTTRKRNYALPNKDTLKAYKALRCVLYQAMEGDVPESEPFKKWDRLSSQLAHRIASEACDAAGVGWDD
jgi:hypothetical protein